MTETDKARKPKALIGWSGGKDSMLCLHKVLAARTYDVAWLLTTVGAGSGRVATHEVRGELIERQAESLGIELVKMVMPEQPQSGDYERILLGIVSDLKTRGLEACIFGDLFLADIRAYREKLLSDTGLSVDFPLWDLPTDALAREFIALGYRARLACVNEQYLGQSFAGREFDEGLIADLPETVDPCGENGEFHSFVWDGPLFEKPVAYSLGQVEHRMRSHPGLSDPSGYWTCDLIPAAEMVTPGSPA